MQVLADFETAVDAIIDRVGKDIVLGIPLGVGKPCQLVNALYQRAVADRSVRLTISTALSLDVPPTKHGLEGRLLNPIYERLYADYPGLDYVRAEREGTLPSNVVVNEFFLRPGAQMNERSAQQGFVGSNYSHAVRDGVSRGVNVYAQMVTPAPHNLGTNADLTGDLLREAERVGRSVLMVGQTNARMPRLGGEAALWSDRFDLMVEADGDDFEIFAVPNEPIALRDWAIGVHAASTVRDGGTLQLGIGALADAVSGALLLRHRDNARFVRVLRALGGPSGGSYIGDTAAFEEGLYGATELFSVGFLELFEAGVLRRRVDGRPGDDAPAALHAGFVLGSSHFYDRLRSLPPEAHALLRTAPISFINEAYEDYRLKCAQRRHARFINTGLKATLLGAVASDTLADQRVISGVGGQYNFVAQAHAIPDARSVLLIRSTRGSSDGVESNIVWTYAHTTIPRHLRDVVITEYGVADLRGRTDAETAKAMLSIADARFMDELRDQAVKAGKLPETFEIPDSWRDNTPEVLASRWDAHADEVETFPFGTDLDDVELEIAQALRTLDEELDAGFVASHLAEVAQALRIPAHMREALERMGLDDVEGVRERVMRRALAFGLALGRD